MAAPKLHFEVARDIARPALTPIERQVFERCHRAAAAGLPAPSTEDLTAAIGASGFSTVPGILKRLEAKGYITREIYQRGRVVCITATGQCTMPPNDQTPHWRQRPDRIPSPTIQPVREKAPDVAAMIEREARLNNRPLAAFLADLAYIGWHEYRAEQERGEG
jgi:hypothetical protein